MSIDREVQTSLHGRRFGLNSTDDLVTNGRLLALRHGNMANRVEFYDDFLGKAIGATWGVQKGSDGAAANFAFLAGTSGLVRATTGAGAGADYATNGVQLDHALNWTAGNGGLVFETNVKISAITNVALFVGLTDQLSALEMPWTISTATFTSNQSDGVGFLFDTGATAVTVRGVGVKADTDATAIDSSIAMVAATYMRFMVGIDASGMATFFINGTQIAAPMANALTTTVALTPCVAAFARAAASRTVDVDFIRVGHDR